MTNTLQASPLPATSYAVALYMTHLTKSHLKSATMRCHLSAIAFFHKIHDHPDPSSSFLIKKLLLSNSKIETPGVIRRAITANILHKLLLTLASSGFSQYENRLYTAIFTIMYHAALRASEICWTPQADHTLQAQQLKIITTNKGDSIKITFHSYKHSQKVPTPMVIYPTGTQICPVKAYKKYTRNRGHTEGPAFSNQNKLPITRQQLAHTLHILLPNCI